MSQNQLDNRLQIHLVKIDKEVKYNDVPIFALKTKDWIDLDNVNDVLAWKEAFYTSRFLNKLCDILLWDYLKVTGGWNTAAQVSNFLCDLLIPHPSAGSESFNASLSLTSHNLCCLLENLVVQYRLGNKTADVQTVKRAVDSLTALCAHYAFLPAKVISSQQLLESLKYDRLVSSKLDEILLGDLFHRILRLDSKCVDVLKRDFKLWPLLRWITERLERSGEITCVRPALSILLVLLDRDPLLVDLYQKRFRNLSIVLDKWLGKGFDSDILRINRCLQRQLPAEMANTHHMNKSAQKIQAMWRGHRTRRRIAVAKSGFRQLQLLFRKRMAQKRSKESVQQQNEDRLFEKKRTALQISRKYNEKTLNAVAGLHPSLVDGFLQAEARDKVVRIQSVYRGYRERKRLIERKEHSRRDRAAAIIQKTMSDWYKRRLAMKRRMTEWPDLTEERRDAIQTEIDATLDRGARLTTPPPLDEVNQKLEECQLALYRHLKGRREQLRDYQRREALLARLQIDTELLEAAPKLSESTVKDEIAFKCRNRAIASEAAVYHSEMKTRMQEPQWKRMLRELD